MLLTEKEFGDVKQDYEVYGTHTVADRYGTERIEVDASPRGTIHVMWHPLLDDASIAEYGPSVSSMYFAIVYDKTEIRHGDNITVYNDVYEVVGIKQFNYYRRIDVRKKKV